MSPVGNETQVDYKVVDDKDVVLTITFGQGQIGASTVLGAAVIVGDVKSFVVGRGAALRGQNIDIHSVVTDVNASTNLVSADYDLTGGDHPQTIALENTVQNEGDSDRFHVVVNFI